MIKKILVIEPELEFFTQFQNAFSSSDHIFVHVGDGKEALLKAQKEKFDCILLEIIVPKIDGFRLLKHFRKKMNLTIPIIVFSHLRHEEDKKVAHKHGANAYFVKAETSFQKISEYFHSF